MISCVACGYQSKRGNRHWPGCRLILLRWIHIDGKGRGVCELPPLTGNEIVELAMMEDQMKERGAKMGPDGYSGKCVIEERRPR